MSGLSHNRVRRTGVLGLILAAQVVFSAHFSSAEEVENSVGMKLRLLDAGRYERGEHDAAPGFSKDHTAFNSGDDAPVHPVVLTKPFYLATTEVTVAQFRAFVEAAAYKTSAESKPDGSVGWDPTPPKDRPGAVATFRDGDEFNWKHPGFEQADDHPVVGVSFADAKAFCDWLSKKENVKYRLPTEAEWEYAARAGTTTYFSFGDAYQGTIHRFANIGNVELEKAFPDRVRRQWLVDIERDPADKHVFTAPVGSYEANPWGIFDLYGNAWEWCEDRYLDTTYASFTRPAYEQIRERAIDPVNDKRWLDDGDWRVIRGGSWFNAPIQCRSSVRGYFEAGDAACYIGFRVVREASAEQIATARRKFEQSEASRAKILRLVERVRERRDGRLTIEINQRAPLTEELLSALRLLDEPVDLYLDSGGELTAAQLGSLLETPQLHGLLLTNIGPKVDDQDFAALAKHPSLELLQLTGAPQLSDGIFQYLPQLAQLELVHFESPQITDAGMQSLAPLKRLKTLRVSGTASRGLCLASFRGSPLDTFVCDHLNDAGAQLLGEFPTVRDVSIGGSPVTGDGLASIAQLPRLNRLDLSGCTALRDADFVPLANVYELSYLHLAQTAAADQTAAALVHLNNLQELQLGSEQLSDAGLVQICGIVSLRNLGITRAATNVTDAGLADLWRLVNLNHLSIAAPKVIGSGLAALHELPALESLGLQGSGFADVACEQVAKSESLKQLSIGSHPDGGPAALTDAGLLDLAKVPNLKQLDLVRHRSAVTDEGLAELRRLQPKLNVNSR